LQCKMNWSMTAAVGLKTSRRASWPAATGVRQKPAAVAGGCGVRVGPNRPLATQKRLGARPDMKPQTR
jgi:hypothetical protein